MIQQSVTNKTKILIFVVAVGIGLLSVRSLRRAFMDEKTGLQLTYGRKWTIENNDRIRDNEAISSILLSNESPNAGIHIQMFGDSSSNSPKMIAEKFINAFKDKGEALGGEDNYLEIWDEREFIHPLGNSYEVSMVYTLYGGGVPVSLAESKLIIIKGETFYIRATLTSSALNEEVKREFHKVIDGLRIQEINK